ncbi:MAG: V-type ATP synthase subunit I [Methanomicrobiaceae archaeon]|uniref:V-type atp synthase subunit i n=1 Tax=hydrocarbon metagenome TaxID=938273 RepID=A0A0W8FEW1_9ZZZZ|nr:V-type ATP synthase subunit I [Methanomicrobiaceae archaeon]
MLSPAEMLFVTIGVHASHAETVVRSLHESGLLEVQGVHEPPGENAPALNPGERAEYTADSTVYRLKIDRILAAISETLPERKGALRDLLVPPRRRPIPVLGLPFRDLAPHLDGLIRRGWRAVTLEQEGKGLDERAGEIDADLRAVGYLLPLGVHPEHIGTSAYLTVIAGSVPLDAADGVSGAIDALGIEEVLVLSHAEKDTATIVVAAVNEYRPAVEEALRGFPFEPISVPGLAGSPEEVHRRLMAEREEIRARQEEIREEVQAIAGELGNLLRAYREELDAVREEGEAFGLAGTTQESVVIEGFVRASDRAAVEALVEQASGGLAFCRFRPPDPASLSVPVAYDNPLWARPFEMLTSMFAVPRYGGIDPTAIIAPIIVLFFGFMLGDAGYGLILLLGACFGYRTLGQGSRSIRDLSLIMIACGAAGILFGILQGGFFGDLLPRFFGIRMPFAVVDPLAQPVDILIVALAIGVVQINAGLLLGLWQNVAAHRTQNGIFEQGSWFVLQPAAAVLLLEFFGWRDFPPAVSMLAAIGGVAGIGMILYAYGPLGAFRITNFLGDWLSYTRILALDLATLGIALTINILTGMIAAIHPGLLAVAIAFAVIAHALNLVLQALGGMIHSLRLQYVEFFGKFYTGGGRPFAPFASKRRYSLRVRGEEEW